VNGAAGADEPDSRLGRSIPAALAFPFAPPGERLLLVLRPSLAMVVLSSLRWLCVLAALAAITAWVAQFLPRPDLARVALAAMLALAAVKLAWEMLDWACRGYALTERRVLRVFGVVRRHVADLPLERIQHLTLDRTLGERLLGVGTIGFATAGTAGVEAYWISVDHPEERIGDVRRAMAAATRRGRTTSGPVVIGLAGGIGAGKSRVAQELARLGAVVLDSDAQAKEALDLPRVRDVLRGWWGEGVIGPDGRVDRAAIARVVFTDPAQRRRLEGLVHPIVREQRKRAISEAAHAGAAVVVDAPLLFEAGVDAECDEVIFVDAPRELRVERVRRTRKWTQEELARRESQQWAPEEKRLRSRYVITNTGDEASLASETARVYRAILGGRSGVDSL
jgi:dephospho-CoA kinase